VDYNLLAIAITGAVVGFLGGYSGVGAAPILIAILVIFFGFDQLSAQGVMTAAMLGPMTLLGVVAMWDRVKLQWPYILSSILAYAIFSYFGADFAHEIPPKYLNIAFGSLLVLLGLNDLIASRNSRAQGNDGLNPKGTTISAKAIIPTNMLTINIVGIFVGFFGGFFGIGAGVFMVPFYTTFMGIHKDDARALSLAVLLPPVGIGAAIKYNQNSSIDWTLAAIIFAAYFATNYFGAKLGRKHSPKQFKFYFGLLMLLMGIAYFSRLWL
jgi:uncharacterized membrane protein YfcA